MKHYMVFGGNRRPVMGGGKYLDWSPPPIGVYSADSPEQACMAAAQDSGVMGTFFAVEGFPWGVEMLQTSAHQLGHAPSANERLASHLDRIEALEREKQRLLAERAEDNDNRFEKVTRDIDEIKRLAADE